MEYVFIDRQVLGALGLDIESLLVAAADRFDGFVDVPDFLPNGEQNSSSGGTFNMMRANEWQVSHNGAANDDDQHDNDDIYIDLGDDLEDDVTAALHDALTSARKEGLPKAGTAGLTELSKRCRPIVGQRQRKSRQADVKPMHLRLQQGKPPVRARVRRYPLTAQVPRRIRRKVPRDALYPPESDRCMTCCAAPGGETRETHVPRNN